MIYSVSNMAFSGWAPLILLTSFFLLLSSCSDRREALKQRLDAYLDAHRRHDTDAVLSSLADDFQLKFPGGFAMKKEDLRAALAWDTGVNGSLTYQNLREGENTIRGLFTERNDFFQLLGIEGLQSQQTFRFDQDGLIVEQIYEPIPDQSSWQEAMEPAIGWASQHRSEELVEIYPNNQMIYTEEMAKRWLILLREWRAATDGK